MMPAQNKRRGTRAVIKNKPTFRKKLLFTGVLLFVLFLFFGGRFLVINEEPKEADAIVVLSGGEGRLEKGMELYKLGIARNIILSNGLADGLWERAGSLVPEESLVLESKADSTYESAVYVKDIMKKKNYHSAIIISSDFHMRRVKYNFDRVFKDDDPALTYVASETSYNQMAWWMSKRNIGITVSEYVKIIGNTFGVHGTDAKRTLYRYVEVFFYE
ncbi:MULTISPECIES: YdcF family protein [Bacillaceae]|uniref:YdcF family protein n=1 Tax=Bacillaceae TaxID=186817 RepID=UPI001681AB7D|nr:YdcF family protein [Bacillus sp. S3]